MQVDDEFILVFGGIGPQNNLKCIKFYPTNNEVKNADDMVHLCEMHNKPEPFYDKYTKSFYVCDVDYDIHKFDHGE